MKVIGKNIFIKCVSFTGKEGSTCFEIEKYFSNHVEVIGEDSITHFIKST